MGEAEGDRGCSGRGNVARGGGGVGDEVNTPVGGLVFGRSGGVGMVRQSVGGHRWSVIVERR